MLKRKASPYLAGRPKGHWWKWKRAALTLDCVLMYAQRGSGKRSSYLFGLHLRRLARGGAKAEAQELVPVGKAYSGFTDEELQAPRHFVRDHTTERSDRCARSSPELVLEVAFERCPPLDAPQVGRRHALSAHSPHPLGQAGGGGRHSRYGAEARYRSRAGSR